ncbi:uncharacterized protein BDZ99DRAFT_553252 [Mytilinidion resinicola]|uniref:Transcription factor domain-containing protein n=1 Tax=Mytilinidion resinicola TaxID=574789 RepID=A0A6A6Y0A0_9PEZI|nr:uncharacterized protein BDZ99DRAFT_553252 [Mytilinidion resinicola]KAF2801434.1 hypothetical protein BDZ99DRAFT_553252 [Mytilinidion resinicola]
MDTTVGPEGLVTSLGLDHVFVVREERRVATRGGPNARETTLRNTRPRTQHNDDVPAERWKKMPSLVANSPGGGNRQEASKDGDMILDSALVISESEFPSIPGDYLDWGAPEIDFDDFLNAETSDETVQHPSSRSSFIVRHSTTPTRQLFQVQQASSSLNASIPRSPTFAVRSLIQRPKMTTGTQRIGNLILHTLKSYPLMMLRHNILPPFIHPRITSSDSEDNYMEPLTNCISLVHMISSGVQGSRKLFWKNVRLECERLHEEHLTLNKWGLLAAMQALSIYILIRLDEGETDHNNFDFLLLATVAVIAKQLSNIISCNTRSAICNYGLGVSWKDWIYEESRRRLAVVYRVVNMLVYFEPAAMCHLQEDLVLAPLPAKKQLWEAGDEFRWKSESERDPGVQTAFGLAANGELVKLDEGQVYCSDAILLHRPLDASTPSRGIANWEEWCSGMDGFGGLVMLAASLIG